MTLLLEYSLGGFVFPMLRKQRWRDTCHVGSFIYSMMIYCNDLLVWYIEVSLSYEQHAVPNDDLLSYFLRYIEVSL